MAGVAQLFAGVLVVLTVPFCLGFSVAGVMSRPDLSGEQWQSTLDGVRIAVATVVVVAGNAVVVLSPPSLLVPDLLPPGQVETAVDILQNAVAAALLALGGLMAHRHGLRRGDRSLDDGDLSKPPAARRRELVVTGVALFLVGLAFGVAAFTAVPLTLRAVLVVAVVLAGVRYGLLSTAAVPPLRHDHGLRDPTPAERSRLAACYDRLGRDPPWLVVSEDEVQGSVVASATGVPVLVVAEEFLASVDDDELAVAVAQADGKGRAGFFETVTVTLTVSVTILTVAMYLAVGWFPVALPADLSPMNRVLLPLLVLLGLVVASLPVVYLARSRQRRAVYRADAAAAETFGPDFVRAVYADHGEALSLLEGLSERGLHGVRRVGPEPTMTARRARLASGDGSEGEPAGPGSGAMGTDGRPGLSSLLVDHDRRSTLAIASPFVVFAVFALPIALNDLPAAVGLVDAAAAEPVVDALVAVYLLLSLATTVFAARAFRRLRRREGALAWVPPRWYYALCVPMLNAVVAMVFFVHRANHLSGSPTAEAARDAVQE